MAALDNPAVPFVGIALMGLCSWLMSCWLPLLETETKAHAGSLPIDGLRGVLASSVFFHHAYITYVFMQTGDWGMPASNLYAQLGPTAVSMFFFISGYLFWGKMLKNPASLSVGRLWPNRLRRIMPAYWASIGAATLIIGIVTGFQVHERAAKIVETGAQLVAVGFPWPPDLGGALQVQVTGGVYWTLRMELLFYLLLPALVWFRKGWRVLLIFAVAGAVYAATFRIHSSHGAVSGLVGVAQAFAKSMLYSFSFGMLVAYRPWLREGKAGAAAAVLQSRWSAVVGLALLAVQLIWIKADYTWYEPLLLVPIFTMVAAGNSFFGVLSSRPMRCLGQVSYSIYIFHTLILFTLTRTWNRWHPLAGMDPTQYWGLIVGIALVVAAVCSLTYWYIERPFLARRPAGVAVKAA